MLKSRRQGIVVKINRGDSVCTLRGKLHRHRTIVIVVLPLPFVWTGSPAHYQSFGVAITFLVLRESPATLDRGDGVGESFFCYKWLSGPGFRAIYETKFSEWSNRARGLGLDWATVIKTVSMPTEKIQKALHRVRALVGADSTSRTTISEVRGVTAPRIFMHSIGKTILPTARRSTLTTSTMGTVISPDARLDLLWFEHILQSGKLQGVPLSHFDNAPEPAVHVYMDASDTGLCALHHVMQQFL
ncbi:LOW QUALITY PROTEIN: hypothetical protein PHMEG_0003377 [Phytophthora megakarya]|uniref:Uncharacterized protein n=1 Tax=Phytophthora megakarya TaxID=4795 RepID=A0A225WYT7_9STRA|nr:LOW QUALITY PROTEIN: hypothetical protein PHMEG_0003377 [Phytophthora megakarya]